MATEKQVAANRRNARKSTGPRTSKGKARSAQNALRHGLLSESVLLPDEDENDFREFAEEGIRELNPRGWLETELAEEIVNQAWRYRRPARVEAGLFTSDRAERDHQHYWDRLMQSRTDSFGQGPSEDGAGTEDACESVMEHLSDAVEARRSEPVLLAAAFSKWAANGDPFGKLQRYETNGYNRLRRMMADFYELQSRRMARERDDDGAEDSSSS